MKRALFCGLMLSTSLACSGSGTQQLACEAPNFCDASTRASGQGDESTSREAGAARDAGKASGNDAAAGRDASSDVEGGVAQSCTPNARRCASAMRLEVCAAEGTAWNALECETGCSNLPEASCNAADFGDGWSVRNFPTPDDVQAGVSYTVSDDGTVATQTVNGTPGIYVNDRVLENVIITGRFSVQTASDDDFIGFVFGYQDDGHYYLLDWKKATQLDGTCGNAELGIALKLVSSADTPASCVDFWASSGSGKVTVLSPASEHPISWVEATDYDFVLRYSAGDIDIELHQGENTIAKLHASDATYPRGRFGFYNYSQSEVRYELFRFEPRP